MDAVFFLDEAVCQYCNHLELEVEVVNRHLARARCTECGKLGGESLEAPCKCGHDNGNHTGTPPYHCCWDGCNCVEVDLRK